MRRDGSGFMIAAMVFAAIAFIAAMVGLFARLAAPDARDLGEQHLGPGSVCGESHYSTARCTRGGQVFLCTAHDGRVGCAEGDVPLPEGK